MALFEEVLDPVGPALGIGRVLLAALLQRLVELLEQLALVLGELDRRLDADMAIEVARVAGAHALDALAAQAEGLAVLKVLPCWVPSGNSISALPPSVGTSIVPPRAAVIIDTGMVQCRSSPSRSKSSCCLMRISI